VTGGTRPTTRVRGGEQHHRVGWKLSRLLSMLACKEGRRSTSGREMGTLRAGRKSSVTLCSPDSIDTTELEMSGQAPCVSRLVSLAFPPTEGRRTRQEDWLDFLPIRRGPSLPLANLDVLTLPFPSILPQKHQPQTDMASSSANVVSYPFSCLTLKSRESSEGRGS
jgi:hypothetical protein